MQSQVEASRPSHPKRDNFIRAVSAIIYGQYVEPDLILVAINNVRDSDLRDDFLTLCRDAAPNFSLPKSSFLLLVDLFRICLRDSNNARDYKAVRIIFSISYQYAVEEVGILLHVGRMLQGHEAWKSLDFWMFCSAELIRFDIHRFSSRPLSQAILLDRTLFMSIVLILRLQAIIFHSMKMVRVPADVVLDFITSVARVYDLSAANVDILRLPVTGFSAWLLDALVSHMSIEIQEFVKQEHDAAEINSAENAKNNESNTHLPKKLLFLDLGYAPELEILFRVVFDNSEQAMKSAAESKKFPTCICGNTSGNWTAIGTFESNSQLSPDRSTMKRDMIKYVLCESCYRRMTQSIAENATPTPSFFTPMTGICSLSSLPGIPPETFLSVFFDIDKNQSNDGLASKVNLDLVKSTVTIKINEYLSDQSDASTSQKEQHNLISLDQLKQLTYLEQHNLTSHGIGSKWKVPSSSIIRQGAGPTEGNRVGGSAAAPRVLVEKPMAAEQLKAFVSAMQAGIDVLKFSRGPPRMLFSRTVFIDKEVSRLCWLPTGRSDLTPAEKHTVILTNILRIQKGAGVNELCMNLICKDREVTLKIEDEGIRSLMISGLVALVDRLKRKMNSQKKPA